MGKEYNGTEIEFSIHRMSLLAKIPFPIWSNIHSYPVYCALYEHIFYESL